MTLLRSIIPVLVTTLAIGQSAERTEPRTRVTRQAEFAVQSLYREVVARHPTGIPGDADEKAFAPYLSKALMGRIDLARACAIDYSRQHQRADEKPEFEWSETGLFSGGNEKASPRSFQIERVQPEKDVFRVFVRLTRGVPQSPLVWRVAAVVLRENGHFVVDDIIYLKDETRNVESRLSEALSLGCDGPHWVGYAKQPDDARQ